MKQKREEMRMYTILIIEDDEAICRELQMLLQKQGYEAICWNMQEDIRELVKTHDPHIILLDQSAADGRLYSLFSASQLFQGSYYICDEPEYRYGWAVQYADGRWRFYYQAIQYKYSACPYCGTTEALLWMEGSESDTSWCSAGCRNEPCWISK